MQAHRYTTLTFVRTCTHAAQGMEERQLQEQEQASHPALTVDDAGRSTTCLG